MLKKKPIWANTDSTKWQDQHVGHWEVSKCYLSTSGYFDKTGPNYVDASGLLSICINSSFINQHISNTQQFEKVRDIRNKTLHDAHYQLDGKTADDCLDKMVTVLEDPLELIHDTFAKQAANHIRKIKAKTEKTPAIMDEALHNWLQTNFDVDQALKEIESQMVERLRTELKQFIVQEVCEMKKSLDDKSNDGRENKLKILQEKLIADILTNYSTIPLNPILQHQDSLLVDFYEPPKMTKTVHEKDEYGKPRTLQKPITEIEELFISNECKDDKSPSHLNRVYLSGEAGMGKTSFSQYLTLAWCAVHGESEECERMREKMKMFKLFNDIEYLEQTQFLFILHLREFENKSDCKDMLKTYLHSQLGYSEKDAHEFISFINSQNTVVLIDGLDEWQCSTKQMPDFNGLNQTNIVCTSRPLKIDSCVTTPTQTYNKITITGIGFNIVERLVRNVTECLRRERFPVRENITDFIKTLDSEELRAIISLRTSESDELLMIPVVILQLLCLWHDYKDFGSTRTQVYVNMAEMLLCRMKKKQNAGYRPDTCDIKVSSPLPRLFEKFHADYCMDEIDNIAKLSRLAFTLLFIGPIEHSLLFRERDLNKSNQRMFKEIKQFCLDSGIVRGTSRKSSSYQDEIYSFIHKSYQEFFAAFHIVAHSCDKSIRAAISANIKSLEDVVELANVFDFVSASDISCVKAMILLIYDLTSKHTMKPNGERKIRRIREIQDMILTACDKNVKENISITVSSVVLERSSYLHENHGSRLHYLPLNVPQNQFRIKLPRMVIKSNKTFNVLCLEGCSIDGSLDLSHCEMEELVLNDVKAECIILDKIGRLKRFTFLKNTMLGTSIIPFLVAKELTLLCMEKININVPMDLSQCPLVKLMLRKVKTERVIVGCVKECRVNDMSCSYDFTFANNLTDFTIKNNDLYMEMCSISGPLDLSHCLLVKLNLMKVKTEGVIVGDVEECLVYDMSCSCDFTLTKNINDLTMKYCSVYGPLDLSLCSLVKLEMMKVTTERLKVGCVEKCSIYGMSSLCDFTGAKNINDLTMCNCSVSGPLDLTSCPLVKLQLINVKTEEVIVSCVKECKIYGMSSSYDFTKYGKSCSYDFTSANNMNTFIMTDCSVSGPLDLSHCPLVKMVLGRVKAQMVKVGCVEECHLFDTSCSFDFTYANKFNYLHMTNCSISGRVDMSQCTLKLLSLINVKTQMLVFGCVEKCTVYGMSCIFDFTYAKKLKNLHMKDCNISGRLDLLQCSLEELNLKEVKTDGVVVGSVEKCSLNAMSCSVDLINANSLIELSFIDCVLPQSVNLSNCPIQSLELLKVDKTLLSCLHSLQTLSKLAISDSGVLLSNCSHAVLKQFIPQNCIQYLLLTTLEIGNTCQIRSTIDLSTTSINQLILHEPNITALVFEEQMEHLYSLPRQITCTVDGSLEYWERSGVGKYLKIAIDKMRTDRRLIVEVDRIPLICGTKFSVVINKVIPIIQNNV